MKPVRFNPEAALELLEATFWYEDERAGLGDLLKSELLEIMDRVATMPQSFPVAFGTSRRALLRRFPYAVYFEEHDDEVVVFAFCHLHRDLSRLPDR